MLEHLEAGRWEKHPCFEVKGFGIEERVAFVKEQVESASSSRILTATTTLPLFMEYSGAKSDASPELSISGRSIPFMNRGGTTDRMQGEFWDVLGNAPETVVPLSTFSRDASTERIAEGESLVLKAGESATAEITLSTEWSHIALLGLARGEGREPVRFEVFLDGSSIGARTIRLAVSNSFDFICQARPGMHLLRIFVHADKQDRSLHLNGCLIQPLSNKIVFSADESTPLSDHASANIRYQTYAPSSALREQVSRDYWLLRRRDSLDLSMRERAEISLQTRSALFTPPDSRFVFSVKEIPRHAVIRFGIAAVIGQVDENSSVRFELAFLHSSGSLFSLFSRSLNPAERWHDCSVDLAGLAGASGSFLMDTTSDSVKSGMEVNAWWSNPSIWVPSQAGSPPRNIILISWDTVRADHMSIYGYDRNTTPYLCSAVDDWVVFQNAISPGSWTLPVHASVFTGLNASTHGVTMPNNRLLPGQPTIGHYLRSTGLFTGGLVRNVLVSQAYGFDDGFCEYSHLRQFSAEEISESASSWIDKHSDLPFFLFLHYFDAHFPYSPPAQYDLFGDPEYAGDIDGDARFQDFIDGKKTAEDISAEDLAEVVSLYDGEILRLDAALQALVQRLMDLSLLDDTMIVLFSDHGEEFAEHGGFAHGPKLHEEVIRVPLLVKPWKGDRS
ncbi:MAG TPA: sulfatase, partial [bacterium]|nr:sulfatase [bacterium]